MCRIPSQARHVPQELTIPRVQTQCFPGSLSMPWRSAPTSPPAAVSSYGATELAGGGPIRGKSELPAVHRVCMRAVHADTRCHVAGHATSL